MNIFYAEPFRDNSTSIRTQTGFSFKGGGGAVYYVDFHVKFEVGTSALMPRFDKSLANPPLMFQDEENIIKVKRRVPSKNLSNIIYLKASNLEAIVDSISSLKQEYEKSLAR